jgi:PKD repeat protein
MKKLLLGSLILGSFFSFAQSIQPVNRTIVNDLSHQTSTLQAKTTSCGVDTVGYPFGKATGLTILSINNATSAQGMSQYFDAPQDITLSGAEFYAYKTDENNGITIDVNLEVYAAGADSMPTGAPLASTLVSVDTTFGFGALSVLKKIGTFTPITISTAYCVVISNLSPDNVAFVFNDYNAAPADGADEWLAGVDLFGTWTRSYNVVVGGSPFNADLLIAPFASYDITAAFTMDIDCIGNGDLVNFTNASSPILQNRMYNIAAFQSIPEFSYTWDFGDLSATENTVDASHTYTTGGAYSITLTDTIYGWTSTCFDAVTMSSSDVPTSSWTNTTNALEATFTNTTAGTITNYFWDFGDGNTSIQESPIHTYASAGTYTVCQTVVNACGADSTCHLVTVTDTPCDDPIVTFTNSANELTVDFTNTSTVTGTPTFLWDLGDGNTSSIENPSHTYSADGDYTVCLTVTDDCATDSTCVIVSANSTPPCVDPTAAFSFSGDPSVDFTDMSSVTGSSIPVTYSWDFGDTGTSTDQNPTHLYTTNGNFTVELTVTDSCGTDVTSQTVTIGSVGIDEVNINTIKVFPNPSVDVLNIQSENPMTKIQVYAIDGRVVTQQSLKQNATTVSTADLSNGHYILNITLNNGQVLRKKIEILH